MARAGLDERRLRPASPLRTPLDDSPDEKGSLSLTSQDWRLRGLGRRGVGDERACDGAGVAPGMIRGGGLVQICHKGAPGRDRPRRKPRNINDSLPAFRLDQEGYSGASEWDWWGSWGDPGRGRVQICHKGAPGRDRSRRKPRNINDSSCAPRLDPGLCGRFGHGPGPDRVRLVPRDPRGGAPILEIVT